MDNLIRCQHYHDRDPLKLSQTGLYRIIFDIVMAVCRVDLAFMKTLTSPRTTQNHSRVVNQLYGCDLTYVFSSNFLFLISSKLAFIQNNHIDAIDFHHTQDMSSRPLFRFSPPGSVLTAFELPEHVGPGDPNLLAAIGCLSQFPRLLER